MTQEDTSGYPENPGADASQPRSDEAFGIAEFQNGSRKSLFAAALLFALTLALFSQAIGYEFLNYDDGAFVAENAAIQRGLSWNGVVYAFTTHDVATWAPVMWLSYMADTSLFGRGPSSYHMTNILLHAAAGVFLFLALNTLTKSFWRSVLVAGIFLVHPLRTESVVWIAERRDVLFVMFWFLGLWGYAGYARQPSIWRYGLVLLCFVCGMMSKFMMVTFPLVLLLLDFWPLARLGTQWSECRVRVWPLVREKIPFFIAMLVLFYFTMAALKSGDVLAPITLDGGQRVLRIFQNYSFYIGKILWPSSLCILYPVGEVQLWRAALGALLLAGVTIFAVRQMWKNPWFLVGWLWFVGTLVPVIGVVSYSLICVADRYSYLPSVGLTIALVYGAAALIRRLGMDQRIGAVAGASVLSACVVATHADLPRWRNSVSLFENAVQQGAHPLAVLNLSFACSNKGDYDRGLRYASQLLEMLPNSGKGFFARGMAYHGKGMHAEAIRDYSKAIEIMPAYAAGWHQRGLLYLFKGDADSALSDFTKVIELEPAYLEALNQRALLWSNKHEYQKAIDDCTRVIAINPSMMQAYMLRGDNYNRMGNYPQALIDYNQAITLAPDSAAAYNHRASAWLGLKKFDEARNDIERCRQRGGKPSEALVKALDEIEKKPSTP